MNSVQGSIWPVVKNLLMWSAFQAIIGLVIGIILFYVFKKHDIRTRIKLLICPFSLAFLSPILLIIFHLISSLISHPILSFFKLSYGHYGYKIEGLLLLLMTIVITLIEAHVFYKLIIKKLISFKMILIITLISNIFAMHTIVGLALFFDLI